MISLKRKKSLPLAPAIALLLAAFTLSACGQKPTYRKVHLSNLAELAPTADPNNTAPPLRVAVGAMISPRGTMKSYNAIFAYLGEKLGRPVKISQRRTYAETNDLIRSGQIDLAFVCTNPYVIGQREFGMELLVTPQVHGQPVYHSYLLVPADSPVQSLADLRGMVFAFTDPMSFTGRDVPTYLLQQMGETPDTFFRNYIFTYGHDNSVRAVMEKLVDGAAVDHLVYEYMAVQDPEVVVRTRIIYRSPPYPAPPLVVPPNLDPALKAQLRDLLLTMHQDPRGQAILEDLMLERFVVLDDAAYDAVRSITGALRRWK